MDIIVEDHSIEHLENLFSASFVLEHPLFSVVAKNTEIKWLVIVPKQSMGNDNLEYVGNVYAEIHHIANFLKKKGVEGHTNIAKIGNKHPNYHIHLVFRTEQDEAWPDAIWCHEPLKTNTENSSSILKILQNYYPTKHK